MIKLINMIVKVTGDTSNRNKINKLKTKMQGISILIVRLKRMLK